MVTSAWKLYFAWLITLKAPTPQNDQTHSNNSSATADKFLSVFDHFVTLALKGLMYNQWTLLFEETMFRSQDICIFLHFWWMYKFKISDGIIDFTATQKLNLWLFLLNPK